MNLLSFIFRLVPIETLAASLSPSLDLKVFFMRWRRLTRQARPLFVVLDQIETWRGRLRAAAWLAIWGSVLLIFVVIAVRWLGLWPSVLSGLALVPLIAGVSGLLKDRRETRERAQRQMARAREMYALISQLKPAERPRPVGEPIPSHDKTEGGLRFRLESIGIEYGSRFRCIVRHPSGRIRSVDVDAGDVPLSTRMRPEFEVSVEYPRQFGKAAAAVEIGEWAVTWKPLLGFKGDLIRYEFDLSRGQFSSISLKKSSYA
jgi:hypothetical protein